MRRRGRGEADPGRQVQGRVAFGELERFARQVLDDHAYREELLEHGRLAAQDKPLDQRMAFDESRHGDDTPTALALCGRARPTAAAATAATGPYEFAGLVDIA